MKYASVLEGSFDPYRETSFKMELTFAYAQKSSPENLR